MRKVITTVLLLGLAACAQTSARREVDAVVEDEQARQAAAQSAQQGQGSKAALEAAAAVNSGRSETPR